MLWAVLWAVQRVLHRRRCSGAMSRRGRLARVVRCAVGVGPHGRFTHHLAPRGQFLRFERRRGNGGTGGITGTDSYIPHGPHGPHGPGRGAAAIVDGGGLRLSGGLRPRVGRAAAAAGAERAHRRRRHRRYPPRLGRRLGRSDLYPRLCVAPLILREARLDPQRRRLRGAGRIAAARHRRRRRSSLALPGQPRDRDRGRHRHLPRTALRGAQVEGPPHLRLNLLLQPLPLLLQPLPALVLGVVDDERKANLLNVLLLLLGQRRDRGPHLLAHAAVLLPRCVIGRGVQGGRQREA